MHVLGKHFRSRFDNGYNQTNPDNDTEFRKIASFAIQRAIKMIHINPSANIFYVILMIYRLMILMNPPKCVGRPILCFEI